MSHTTGVPLGTRYEKNQPVTYLTARQAGEKIRILPISHPYGIKERSNPD
ncbi:MAG: hypothetical protein LBE91_07090 [Tannerella sp.]|nr:hypothetical protein [Tannerella sp.]